MLREDKKTLPYHIKSKELFPYEWGRMRRREFLCLRSRVYPRVHGEYIWGMLRKNKSKVYPRVRRKTFCNYYFADGVQVYPGVQGGRLFNRLITRFDIRFIPAWGRCASVTRHVDLRRFTLACVGR